ncbi:LD-carboxypeptidase [Nocardioides sp. CFH 31398]|uniref:S66 peptidase family protein n=1 Tax=Nocardioides sp. CFH 31398 TaxID=2919579 RepID=UPI001F05D1A4|nr:LD-carboxypeptidase [Nocardioides sp. CFH 31398]MCH1867706.1 LD-carboxypeptidase [Nocardioides sp. CFH 31398]
MTAAAPTPPPALRPGDLVAAVAPAGPAGLARVAEGTALLTSWGLRVRPAVDLGPAETTWLAGPDAARAQAVTQAWCDPDMAAVWTLRGGVGCHRVVDLLDWPAMAAAAERHGPRLLVGYSDVTALHQAVGARLGLGGLHAAGIASLPGLHPDAAEDQRALLLGGTPPVLAGRPAVGGVATGPLVGGNLTVLAAGAGTPGVQPAAGRVVLLEDVGEAPYRLDRAVTQLARSGWLDRCLGVAVGQLTDCGDATVARDVLVLRLRALGVPVVTDLPLGHEADSRSVPIGAVVHLDGDAGTLQVLEPLAPLRPGR